MRPGRYFYILSTLFVINTVLTSFKSISPFSSAFLNPNLPLMKPFSNVRELSRDFIVRPSVRLRCNPRGIEYSLANFTASRALSAFTRRLVLETTPDWTDSTIPRFLCSQYPKSSAFITRKRLASFFKLFAIILFCYCFWPTITAGQQNIQH